MPGDIHRRDPHNRAPVTDLRPSERFLPVPTAVALLWGCLLTLCVTGYTFGQSNHHVYLLDAIRFGHEELLARDWFTTHTLQYHVLFTRLTVALQSLGWVEAGFFTFYLGLVIGLHAAWLSIVRSLGLGLSTYLLSVLLYHISGGGLGLGVYQFLQDGSFLPSNVAAVACLAAIAWWLRGRIWPAAICVALAGLFHVNYALACIGAWSGLSAYAMVRDRAIRPFLSPRYLLPSIVALLPCGVVILLAAREATVQDATIPMEEFVAVYVRLRHSHHHEPLAWPAALWASFLWPIPFALLALWRLPKTRAVQGVAVVLIAVLAVQLFAFLFAGVWYVNASIVKLSLFRFSPFAKLLSCVLAAWWLEAAWRPTRGWFGIAMIAIVAVGLFALTPFRSRWPAAIPTPSVGFLVGGGLLAVWLGVVWRHRIGRSVGWTALLAAGAIPCLVLAAQQRLGVTMPGEGDPDMAQVCTWAREQTRTDALFLVPPHDQSFTLAARRAEVVGFKHVPQLAAELVEWKRRLDEVLDMNVATLPTPMSRTMQAMADRYATLSPEHLRNVAAHYDCDYVIAMSRWPGVTPRYESTGQRYFVYATR